MTSKTLLGLLLVLACGQAQWERTARAEGGATNSIGNTSGQRASAPALVVEVEPRVELLSLIFRLAGNSEYNRAGVQSYADEAEAQFGPFREQPVVQLADKLRRTSGVSYDAVMGMAIHLSDVGDLRLRAPLAPWPESLDRRWNAKSASSFVAAARQFVKASGFQEFVRKHQPLYATTVARLRGLLERKGHLEWFNAYFGERPGATFTVVPGMLNGGSCYGAHFKDANGRQELYCILGVWQTDAEGVPEFTDQMLNTVVHEFCHSYANPLIDRHEAQLREAGETLFRPVAGRMRSQAYGNALTMLRESLVRACTCRYVRQFEGAEAARRAVQQEQARGFLWMAELSGLLEEYEAKRSEYPTLEDFAPRLVSFFNQYAQRPAARQKAPGTQRAAAGTSDALTPP